MIANRSGHLLKLGSEQQLGQLPEIDRNPPRLVARRCQRGWRVVFTQPVLVAQSAIFAATRWRTS